jgi:hypothetical protein
MIPPTSEWVSAQPMQGDFVPRSLARSAALAPVVSALLIALALGSVARPALAAEPVPEQFLAAAADAGLPCEEVDTGSWHCENLEELSDRSFFATVDDDEFGFYLTVYRGSTEPAPAEPEVLGLMNDFVHLALGADDAEVRDWLAEMHDGRSDVGTFEQDAWTFDWYADWEGNDVSVEAAVQLIVTYNPAWEPQPQPEPSAGEASLACSLLSAEEVESVTGLDAHPGVAKETHTVGQMGCGWGTEPYEVQVAIMPSTSGRAVDGLGDSGYPVEDLGDGAFWWWCDVCEGSGSSSTNHLVVASGDVYVDIGFEPQTDAAADDSELVQEQHLAWAIELARLILPRLDTGSRPLPSAAPAEPASSAVPESGQPAGSSTGVAFGASIPEPAQVSTDPTVLLQSAALAALLVFLMPFPSQLFNSTLETHESEVRRWLRLDRIGAAVAGIGAFWSSWLGVLTFTALAALLYGFLDPGFGLDLGSLATFTGMLLGIVLVTAAFAVPVIIAHRRLGDRPSPKVVPISLLVGVACVLVSRVTSFQPGYLYGLLIGFAFATELSATEEGRVTAIGAGLMLGVSLLSWLGLGLVPDADAFGIVVVRTALAALLVAGLEGVVFGLLPMRFLPGEPLYQWNRVLWGALLLVGAFAFFHILINPASGYLSDTSRTPLFTVIALLLGFSLVSVAFWAWFRFRAPAAGPIGATPDAD